MTSIVNLECMLFMILHLQKLNVTGASAFLSIDETDASGLNQITFTPTAAGQTVTFQAG